MANLKIELVWTEKMVFEARAGEHRVSVDALPPLDSNRGMAPKELLLSALASCTAMDVVALLKKHKQKLERFRVEAEGTPSEGGHPKRFVRADLTFDVTGEVDRAVLLESVQASQSMYCGISAMLSRAFPIAYQVVLNGALVGSGEATFEPKPAGA